MSNYDVLAASLWPWPDPLIKRDPAGNIIFVNASFIGLYGGSVQEWTGQPLAGWPLPSPQGSQRFETRIPVQDQVDTVYDWVESYMPDGTFLAIARDVTIFTAQPITAPQQIVAEQVAPQTIAPQIVEQAIEVQAAPIQEAAIAPAPLQAEAVQMAPPIEQTPATIAPTIADAAPSSALDEIANNTAEDYARETAPIETAPAAVQTEPITAAPQVQIPQTQIPQAQIPQAEPAPIQSAVETPSEEPRMIERRALPIEDSSSVLGTNWRDQVIAKAIGSEIATSDAIPTDTLVPAIQAEITTPLSTAANQSSEPETLNILLAEDNAINALLTRTLLEADGAIVTTVEDGALAVEAVKKEAYDLIFMDMRMPNMDGLESTRKIRALGYSMPIIALTANAFDDDRNSCFDSGMNDFMTKPVSAEELSEMVTTWIENSKEHALKAS